MAASRELPSRLRNRLSSHVSLAMRSFAGDILWFYCLVILLYHSLSALVIGYILKASALLHLLRDVSCSLAFSVLLGGLSFRL